MNLQLQFYFYVINGLKIATLLSKHVAVYVYLMKTLFMVINTALVTIFSKIKKEAKLISEFLLLALPLQLRNLENCSQRLVQ